MLWKVTQAQPLPAFGVEKIEGMAQGGGDVLKTLPVGPFNHVGDFLARLPVFGEFASWHGNRCAIAARCCQNRA